MALNGELRTVTKSMFYGTGLSKEVYCQDLASLCQPGYLS